MNSGLAFSVTEKRIQQPLFPPQRKQGLSRYLSIFC